MEKRNNEIMQKNKTLYGLLFSIITIFLSVITAFNSEIILFAGMVALSSYAISSYLLPKHYALFTPIIVFIIVFSFSNNIYLSFFSILLFFPAGYLISVLFKKEIGIKNTLLFSIVPQVIAYGSLILTYIYIRGGALNLNSAKFVFSNYIEIINNSIAQYEKLFKLIYPKDIETANALFVQFESYLIESVVPTIPSLLVLFIAFCIFIAFIITKVVLKGCKFNISNNLDIKNFKVSKSVVIFTAISFLIILVTGQSSVNVAFENVFLVLNGALFLAGIALIINFMNLLKIVFWKKIIGFICIAFLCLIGGATIVSFFGGVSSFVEIENFKKKE